ncbi:MAG: hypothetical protein P1U42_10600, partial [Phycisphaerales bacterium]|nr:hypothetical protein [Phycisphaerales bacterium]
PMSYLTPILADPQLAIPKKEQYDIAGSVKAQWFNKPRNRLLYFASLIPLIIVLLSTTFFLARSGNRGLLITVLLWTVFSPTYILTISYLFFITKIRPLVYKELHNRGHDICLKCSYKLIDLPQSQTACPECGTPRTPIPDNPKVDKPYY